MALAFAKANGDIILGVTSKLCPSGAFL